MYICKNCGNQAQKPPLKPVTGWQSASVSDFGGLGKWRCLKCGKTKVKRENNGKQSIKQH